VHGVILVVFKEVICSHYTAVVATSGDVYCFGRNTKGQLGKGDWEDTEKPRKVKNPEDFAFVQVACGGQATLALAASGELFACGEGTTGRTCLFLV
jgi:alpha-tubulin suppressor-like RCC1 family protein